ncbi:MAG TPA: matrixin family metalloprotease [Candidatus Sulfotelmatobacter sp.]|nr:matrixin family metalloprotease [Candidatus Sulfotelmatobacter sp.]
MKKLLIFFLIIGLLFITYQNKTVSAKVNQFLYQSPCDVPKTFRIGSIDPRFNISKKEFLQDTKEAGTVWKNSQGMVLMEYDPNSNMPVNMIYDQRQALNSQINNLNSQVTQQKNTLKPEISSYENQVTEFKKKSDALNEQIQYWNSKGGAPQDVYKDIITQQQSLQQQATQLQQEADQLNQSTDQYNQQINQLNQNVDNYNNVLTYKPEEGLYNRDGINETINIYFNNSHQELIHTIAHEMGHALGLGHNNNLQSIMYPQTNLAIIPTIDDKNALTIVCKKRSIFEIAKENIVISLGSLHQNLNNMMAQYQ